jgi:energy-coupling factor transporter ATP-binding protein EcfA2
MTRDRAAGEKRPRIVGVYVPAYKNLRDVWVPWHTGLALIGANGSGKTNLLEAMALLLGTEATMRRAQPRLAWSEAPGLSVVVGGDHDRMPIDDERATFFPDSDPWPGYAQLREDKSWWDPTHPDDSSPAWLGATVRYTLEAISLDAAGLRRTFRRELMPVDGDPFVDGAWADPVLELSVSTQAPARLQWLPSLRREEEVVEDLESAFAAALPDVDTFSDSIATAIGLPLDEHEGAGADWIVHEHGATVANGELRATSPTVWIESEGAQPADWRLHTTAMGATAALGRIGEGPLGQLSAGQQRWADEALASLAGELRALGQRSRLYENALTALSGDQLWEAAVLTLDADERIRAEGFWTYADFVAVLGAVGPALTAAAESQYVNDPSGRRYVRMLMPFYEAIDPQLVVRVFDEPEAHLHPAAQRRVAQALETIRNEGADVVIASHSPTFIDRPDWRTLHVRDGGVELLPPEAAVSRTALARDLGVTTGELLSTVEHLLVVEGEHDRLVLEELWGAELRAAGIVVVRMLGTHNILATVDLDFIERFLDVDMTVMLDHTRLERLAKPGERTQEERKLLHLRRTAKARGRRFSEIGLERPDIVCYLSETAVRSLHPTFPGWSSVIAKLPDRPLRFKEDWLLGRFQVDLTDARHVGAVLDLMRETDARPVGELTRKIEELLADQARRVTEEP